jgi:hypothetical protein
MTAVAPRGGPVSLYGASDGETRPIRPSYRSDRNFEVEIYLDYLRIDEHI